MPCVREQAKFKGRLVLHESGVVCAEREEQPVVVFVRAKSQHHGEAVRHGRFGCGYRFDVMSGQHEPQARQGPIREQTRREKKRVACPVGAAADAEVGAVALERLTDGPGKSVQRLMRNQER